MRMTGSTMTMAALVAGLVACEGGAGAGGGDTTMMTGGADTANMSEMQRQQEGMGERMQAQLQPVNNSGVSGEVNLTPAGNGTTITLTLEGSDAAEGEQARRHLAHVHTGTCANIGSVVAPLDSIVADSGRGLTSTTLVDIDAATLADGNHLVAAHEAGGNPGRPIVCADIPRQMGGTGQQGDTMRGQTDTTTGGDTTSGVM